MEAVCPGAPQETHNFLFSTGVAHELHTKTGKATRKTYIYFLRVQKMSTYEWYKNCRIDTNCYIIPKSV